MGMNTGMHLLLDLAENNLVCIISGIDKNEKGETVFRISSDGVDYEGTREQIAEQMTLKKVDDFVIEKVAAGE